MDRARSPAAQQPCRVNPQQVSSARSRGSTWAGLWVWFVPCVTPPAICPIVCVVQHRPSAATWGPMPGTMRPCTSCWVWACPCCLFSKRSCCTCTQRLCLMSPALCSLCCCGCRSISATRSSRHSADSSFCHKTICSRAQAPFVLFTFLWYCSRCLGFTRTSVKEGTL